MLSTNTLVLFWGLMFILTLTKEGLGPHAQSVSTSLCYSKENHSSYLPFLPKRLISSPWTGIPHQLQCARRSLSSFPVSRGFLYNPASGRCSPLLWLEAPSAQGAQPVQPEDGELYLSCGVCGDDFEVMELASGDLVCLRYVNEAASSEEAASHCSEMGAYLVSVKTLDKLTLLKRIAKGNVLVGFRYLRSEGVYSWLGHDEILTRQQIEKVFLPGEPNDDEGIENCGEFNHYAQGLNDIPCDFRFPYICEKALPVLNG
ncbi:lectin C-type domain containing protein [Elysia marginata]|uniref:Lectin C-type domain containing protein n=1 Tax=Elysia marginata TaxID=1093978 RepID=A0AAV4HE04_9GAST|nr:lectin C-type domain containing protein [Elysia marginata]